MLGTLNGALEVRRVQLGADDLVAEARGFHEIRNGLPVLERIEIAYTLRIPAGSRETVDRALAKHQSKCPTAASLAGAVELIWTAAIEESAS